MKEEYEKLIAFHIETRLQDDNVEYIFCQTRPTAKKVIIKPYKEQFDESLKFTVDIDHSYTPYKDVEFKTVYDYETKEYILLGYFKYGKEKQHYFKKFFPKLFGNEFKEPDMDNILSDLKDKSDEYQHMLNFSGGNKY